MAAPPDEGSLESRISESYEVFSLAKAQKTFLMVGNGFTATFGLYYIFNSLSIDRLFLLYSQ